MASRVADGEKDRQVAFFRIVKSFLAPRAPIHRIVGMLEKIRTLLLNQSVRVHGLWISFRGGLGISRYAVQQQHRHCDRRAQSLFYVDHGCLTASGMQTTKRLTV